MQIVAVSGAKQVKQFHEVAHRIYKNDKNWIQHLHKDIEDIFDKTQNAVFQHGEAARWILLDDNNKPIGRVAAFINHKALKIMEFPVGGMGFFECIDDEKAAFLLFDTCKNWLEAHGMKGMDGPINFGERDRFWGLLVEGFDSPSYMENYNPAYYRKFFEDYGFRLYFEQFTYSINSERFEMGRLEKIASWVMRKPDYSFAHLQLNQMDKFADDFVQIYNAAWQKFENFKPVTRKEILSVFKQLKPITIQEYIWFAYVNGKPAAFIVMVPDVNQLFKYVNGKLNLIGKLKFMYYKLTKPMHKLKGLVFGIHPEYHNLGLDAALVYHLYKEVSKTRQYTEAGISWIGGFNPKMHSLIEALHGNVAKIHHTYRKLFDENLVFKPYALNEYSKPE
jgi:hypothetical protein